MKKLLILLCSFSFIILNAQEYSANWYFGDNGGLNFDPSGVVTPLTNGKLVTAEGCATISSLDGNLLFYTDGTTVYNANHVVMQNGFGLLGDASSSQSAIIVPKPNDSEIYYIFTIGSTNISNQNFTGLNYSEVNMTLDGGLGAITSIKNRTLLNTSAEKISAVIKDCESIWIVTFSEDNPGDHGSGVNSDSFYAFEINNAGVSNTPVVSKLNMRILDRRGTFKFSPNGTKLACANFRVGLFIADFSPETGIVSNPQFMFPYSASIRSVYGIEFSPSGELLYATVSNDIHFDDDFPNPVYPTSILVQYNLVAPDFNVSKIIDAERQLYRGGLQLGPNGKIYRALSFSYDQGSSFLGVINDPNTLGLGCNYEHDAIDLGTGISRQGLPQAIQFTEPFSVENIDIIQDDINTLNLALCEGDVYTLKAEDIVDASYIWAKDGVILPETDSDLEIFESGNYEVFVKIMNDQCTTFKGQAIVTYSDNPEVFNVVLTKCEEDDLLDGLTLFDLTEANEELTGSIDDLSTKFYNSQIDAENDTNEIQNPSAYNNISNPEMLYVRVTNDDTECIDFSMLTLNVSVTQIDDYVAPEVCDETDSIDGLNTFNLNDFSADIRLLNGLTNVIVIKYYKTLDDALSEENELPIDFENTTPYSQIIYARADNDNACYSISNVTLTIQHIPEFEENNIIYYCLNTYPDLITLESNLIIDPSNTYSYLWSTGETTSTIEVNEIGSYTVTITDNNGCTNTNTISVEPSNIATINDITIVDGGLENNTVTIEASGEGVYEYALFNSEGLTVYPYQESNVFNSVFPGIYTISVRDIKNDCGTVETIISVIGFPKFFTPNGDGINDTWQVYGVNEQFQPNTVIYILDRYGKLLKEINPLSKGWDGTFNGNPLPTNDYWFYVTLQDGRTFKNHFSLKR